MLRIIIALSVCATLGCDTAKKVADEVNDVFKDVDAGTGMVEFMASVDGETKVKDLDDNQKADINNDLKNAVNGAITANDYCNQAALAAAASNPDDPSGRCTTVVTECKDAAQTAQTLGQDPKKAAETGFDRLIPDEYKISDATLVFKGDVSNCGELKVSKLATCLDELGQKMIDGMRNVTCASLTVETAIETLKTIAGNIIPKDGACADIEIVACPGLFIGDADKPNSGGAAAGGMNATAGAPAGGTPAGGETGQ